MARIFFFLLVVVAVVVVDTHKSAPPVLPFHGNPAFDLTFRRLKGSITIMMKTYARFLQHSETPALVPSICVYTRKKYPTAAALCTYVYTPIQHCEAVVLVPSNPTPRRMHECFPSKKALFRKPSRYQCCTRRVKHPQEVRLGCCRC